MEAFNKMGLPVGETAASRGLRSRPRFHMKAVQNDEESQEKGHPVFRDKEYVEIIAPGNNQRHICRVQDSHREMWPEHYKAFKDGTDPDLITGFPLAEWPMMTVSAAETLKGVGVFSLEDLCGCKDDDIKSLGPGFLNMKYKATEFLKDHNSSEVKIFKLEAQNKELLERLEALEDNAKSEPQACEETVPSEDKPATKVKAKTKAK